MPKPLSVSNASLDLDKNKPGPPGPVPVPPTPPRLSPSVWRSADTDGYIHPVSEVFRSLDPTVAPILFETVYRPNREPDSEREEHDYIPLDQLSGNVEWRDSPLAYAVSDTNRIQPEVTLGEWKLAPQSDKHGLIADRHVLFASGLAEYGTAVDLVQDICAFILAYCDVPSTFWVLLMAAYVLMTWLFDAFDSAPYLRFLGQWQSGKTRFANVLAHLCYKTILSGGASSSAVLFRMLDRFRGCLYIDEAQYKDSGPDSDIIRILNVGYKRDPGSVLRCDSDNDPEPFRVFGPKILTNRTRFKDEALESRCLTLEMHERVIRADIPVQLPKVFYRQAEELRNKLLLWRFRTYPTLETDEFQLRLKDLDNRQTEITVPLLAVMRHDPAFADSLAEFCQKRKREERGERPEADIVAALVVLAQEKLKACPTVVLMVKDAAQQASELKIMREPEAARTANIRPTGEEPQFYTSKKAGYLIRMMGLETRRIKTGYEFNLSATKLAELLQKYPLGPDPSDPDKPKTLPKAGGRCMNMVNR